MKIHKTEETDAASITNFVNRVFTEYPDLQESFFASMNSKMNEGIYTLGIDRDLAVVATIHSSSIHPFCRYVRLAYNFTEVEREELLIIVRFLKKEYSEPLFFLLDNRFANLANILVDEEFRFIRKTEVICFQPQFNMGGVIEREVKSAAELIEEPILFFSLMELCKFTYTQTHLDNPVVEMPLERWEQLIMSDLILESSYVVLHENKVIAFSLMHTGDEDYWELGWMGVANDEEIALLDDLLRMQLRDAFAKGVAKIEKEVDSTCPYSLHVSKSLVYKVSETLFAYIEDVE